MADKIDFGSMTPEQMQEFMENFVKLSKEMQRTSDAFSKLSNSNSELLKAFSALGKKTNNLIDDVRSLVEATGELFSKEGLSNTLNLAAGAILKASQDLEKSFEKMRGEFILSSGQTAAWGTQMREAMQDASNNISKFGVSTKDAMLVVNSSLNLMQGDFDTASKTFSKLSQDQLQNKESVMTNIALMQQFGISAEQTAKSIDVVYNSISITTGANADFSAQMSQASNIVAETTLEITNMGFSISQASSIMQKGSDIALVFGKEALQQLAGQASRTRIEFDSLVAVAAKFDTFDSAAQHVGKLNALLGADYIGVTDMMFAEPAERVKMLSGAFDQADLSAESLKNVSEAEKNFTLMTIQSTLGLKDKNEALKFLNADEFDRGIMLQKQQDAAIDQANAQAKMNQMLLDAMPAMEQFANAFKNLLSIMQPVLEIINGIIKVGAWIVEFFGSAAKSTEGWVKTLLSLIGTITFLTLTYFAYALAVTKVAAAKGALSGALSKLIPSLAGTGAAAPPAAQGIGLLGQVAALSWPQLLALGAAIALVAIGIGVGIAAAAFGLSYLVEAFQNVGDNGTAAATAILLVSGSIGLFTMALLSMLPAATAAPLLLPIAGVILAIGAAIGIAAAGFGYLVSSFASLEKLFVILGTFPASNLLSIAGGLYVLTGALIAFAGAGIGVSAAGAVSGIIGGIGGIITGGVRTDPLGILSSLSQIDDTKFTKMATAVKSLVDSLNASVNTQLLVVLNQLNTALSTLNTITALNPAVGLLLAGAAISGTAKTTSTTETSGPTEMVIKNIPVVIKIGDTTSLDGHIEKITIATMAKYGIATR